MSSRLVWASLKTPVLRSNLKSRAIEMVYGVFGNREAGGRENFPFNGISVTRIIL